MVDVVELLLTKRDGLVARPLVSSSVEQGTVEADEWKAADWTIESIVQRYPDMLVRVGSGKSTNDDIQITMSQFYK